MIQKYKDVSPQIDESSYVAESAVIIGDVILSSNTSVWPNATLRGDMAAIKIGKNSNVQDNSVIHVNRGMETILGENVTVGHAAILHACTIGDGALIGMGAIILDQAEIGENSLVAAGSLVPPRKKFPAKSLIMGNPAKVVKELSDADIEDIKKNCQHYVELGQEYKEQQ
jgi:carbonic anhydrase/acetyltransferase-like protein (isoleucine patch superfamily)